VRFRGRFRGTSLGFAIGCLLALAGCASRGVAPRPSVESTSDPLSTIPAGLSVERNAGCQYGAHRHLIVAGFERGRRAGLELGIRGQAPSEFAGGVASAIAREFACTRYVIEVALPLLEYDSGGRPAPAFERDISLLEAGIFVPRHRGTLWSVADALRLSASEPFVYGKAVELSEEESVSLRLEPKGSGGRLMLVYRIDL